MESRWLCIELALCHFSSHPCTVFFRPIEPVHVFKSHMLVLTLRGNVKHALPRVLDILLGFARRLLRLPHHDKACA
jgi:hypothetical protein